MGVSISTTLQQYELNPKQIKGPVVTPSGAPPGPNPKALWKNRWIQTRTHEAKQEMGVSMITTLQQYELNPKQIKGSAVSTSGEPPRSALIIDQTLILCGKIDGSKQKQSQKCTRRTTKKIEKIISLALKKCCLVSWSFLSNLLIWP
jgi:hypothetical protein